MIRWAAAALDRAAIDPDRVAIAFPTLDPASIPVRVAGPWFRALWFEGISAVAMPWAIYVHPRRITDTPTAFGRLIVHELAHIDQWRRLGPLGWARRYLGDYLRGRRKGLGHRGAYMSIGLEVEARNAASRLAG